jgi:hypothetical protein
MSTDPTRYELGLEEIITFMGRLKGAGMSNEEVVKHGYAFALEMSAMWRGEPVPAFLQMEYASVKLERAAIELGMHTKQLKREDRP